MAVSNKHKVVDMTDGLEPVRSVVILPKFADDVLQKLLWGFDGGATVEFSEEEVSTLHRLREALVPQQ